MCGYGYSNTNKYARVCDDGRLKQKVGFYNEEFILPRQVIEYDTHLMPKSTVINYSPRGPY